MARCRIWTRETHPHPTYPGVRRPSSYSKKQIRTIEGIRSFFLLPCGEMCMCCDKDGTCALHSQSEEACIFHACTIRKLSPVPAGTSVAEMQADLHAASFRRVSGCLQELFVEAVVSPRAVEAICYKRVKELQTPMSTYRFVRGMQRKSFRVQGNNWTRSFCIDRYVGTSLSDSTWQSHHSMGPKIAAGKIGEMWIHLYAT